MTPSRTQSMPLIRIITTRTDQEEYAQDILDVMDKMQMESQEEDELLRLRLQLQAESASRKFYSTSSLHHASTSDNADSSRVSAQRSLSGPPVVPDTATDFTNERVLRRFPTPPPRPKSSVHPLRLYMEEEEEYEALPKTDSNKASTASSSQRLFCGIPASCNPSSKPKSESPVPGIEMQHSFRTLFEPINDKARRLFGSSSRTLDDDGASSAVTEPFDNRSLQRNGTWTSTFSVQEYLNGWNLSTKEKRGDTPTSVAQVPGQTIRAVADKDVQWDTDHLADRMEQSLRISSIAEPDMSNDGISSEACVFPVEDVDASPVPVSVRRAENMPFEYQLAHDSKDFRTKYASSGWPAEQITKKDRRTTSPVPGDSFWEELLAEGVVEQEDFSACSGGFGIEVVNMDD